MWFLLVKKNIIGVVCYTLNTMKYCAKKNENIFTELFI